MPVMSDDTKFININEIRPGAKNVNAVFIVLSIGKPTKTKDGHEVRSCRVADKSGCINLSVWDDYGTLMQSGDIIRLHKGYASIFKGSLTMYMSKYGSIEKIGDFCMVFSEQPNMSDPNAEFLQLYKKTNDKPIRDTSNTHTLQTPTQSLPPPPPPHGPSTHGQPPTTSSSNHSQPPSDPRSGRFHPYSRDTSQGNIVNAAKDPRLRNRGNANANSMGRGASAPATRVGMGGGSAEAAPKNIINTSRDPRNRNR
ncbi:SOSS complex subunit B1-B-like [Dendronephthya gigantea]|uniref:SOSS complex subunit B1-B-like n=1 Tax=Dendronephthya gigantea TaxID=151771 RepID=UPI00106BB465|nr:SOSS complex subunit B1-B-like [Dendronephthya gigantea]